MSARTTEGYRYVRGYRVKDGSGRWALWERQRGRARRVGTTLTRRGYMEFLGLPSDMIDRSVLRNGNTVTRDDVL